MSWGELTCKKCFKCDFATIERCNKECPAYQPEEDKDLLRVCEQQKKERIYHGLYEDIKEIYK